MKVYHPQNICTVIVLCILIFSSCIKKTTRDETKELADADRYYSRLSVEKGRNFAFLAMFDSAGVTLAPHRLPIEGYKEIKKQILSQSDRDYTLTWEPMFAKVAASGELGYTYGTYKLTDKVKKIITDRGTYTTFWQKDAQGHWKALMDTGNEGLK